MAGGRGECSVRVYLNEHAGRTREGRSAVSELERPVWTPVRNQEGDAARKDAAQHVDRSMHTTLHEATHLLRVHTYYTHYTILY